MTVAIETNNPTTSSSSPSSTTKKEPILSSAPPFQPLQVSGIQSQPHILSSSECQTLLSEIWDYIEDVTCHKILRSSNDTTSSPYSSPLDDAKDNVIDITPFGSHWIGTQACEWLADRVYQSLYDERRFHVTGMDWLLSLELEDGRHVVTAVPESHSFGDEGDARFQIVCLLAVSDGTFCFSPRCGGGDGIEGGDDCGPLVGETVVPVSSPVEKTVRAGDVILYRSDEWVYNSLKTNGTSSPLQPTVGILISMTPASLDSIPQYRVDCYRNSQRLSSCHPIPRPGSCPPLPHLRNFFRYGPPPLSLRSLRLFHLLPYRGEADDDPSTQEVLGAILRGVIFEDSQWYNAIPTPFPEGSDDIQKETITNQIFHSTAPPLSHHRTLSLRGGTIPPARAQSLYLPPHNTPILGQDKFLGGIVSHDQKHIFAVPGHAKRVLALDVARDELEYIGPEVKGEFKWLRGVTVPPGPNCPEGLCIALPSNAKGVLKVDPATREVTIFGEHHNGMDGSWKYHGGDWDDESRAIYAIPANAPRVIKIDPFGEVIEDIGPDFGMGRQKWYGGIRSKYDGCIYGVPHNASRVLKINPQGDDVTLMGPDLGDGEWKWHGGLATSDGTKIISFPNNHHAILMIDVPSQRVYEIGGHGVLRSGRHRNPRDDKYKYLGGAMTLDGRYAYLFPADAERVLRIDILTEDVRCVGPILSEGWGKYQNGFCSPRDGCIYGIPQRSKSVIRIIPPMEEVGEEVVDMVYCGDEMVMYKDKFEGGVMVDGIIHCMPLRAKGWLKVIPPQL